MNIILLVVLSAVLWLAGWDPTLAQSNNVNCSYNGKSYGPFSASICMNGYMARCVGNIGEMRPNGGWVRSQYIQCTEPKNSSRKRQTH